jgi:hypothetical protein
MPANEALRTSVLYAPKCVEGLFSAIRIRDPA